ncbi:FAD-dependent oxidoreductase [Eubacteriales bacterium OttesenSCG-928-N13]|nr:FAD-dependent oxidoreductase [Eubacteriales bacterium OttesenSCG-928-N13]
MKERYDVIVAGGGPAGIAAALSAARNGAHTLLVERYGFLGGMLTAGLVAHYDPIEQMEATGIPLELYSEMKQRGGVVEYDMTGIEMPFRYWQGGCGLDAEIYKQMALDLLKSAGADVLLHAFVSDASVRDGKLESIGVAAKGGHLRLHADVFVDATGDGDLCVAAGVPFELGDGQGHCMGSTLCFNLGGVDTETLFRYLEENPDELGNHPRLGKYIRDPRATAIVQGFYSLIAEAHAKGDLAFELPESGLGMCPLPTKGTFHVNAIRLPGKNPVDPSDLTELEIVERGYLMNLFAFIKKYVPGCAEAFIMTSGVQVGVRESRHIKGEHRMILKDIEAGTRFPDAVVRTKWGHTDVHSGSGMQWSFSFIEGPYYIPYRALVPMQVDGLLAAGRLISAEQAAMASFRIMPVCSSIGEAAGAAAALCAKNKQLPRRLDAALLQDALIRAGVRLD